MKTNKAVKHTPEICVDCHLWPMNGTKVQLCVLHAAAPELLEAAKAIEEAIHQSWPSCTNPKHKGGTCDICQSRRNLRAAIAKAEGREG